jgi:hypothetical protein
MIGIAADACFLACLAAFFSFAVDAGCFFASLLLCLILPMALRLDYARQVATVTQAYPQADVFPSNPDNGRSLYPGSAWSRAGRKCIDDHIRPIPDPDNEADSSKSEEPQDEQDDNDQPDNVDDVVHETFLRAGHATESHTSTDPTNIAVPVYPVGAMAHMGLKTCGPGWSSSRSSGR